MSTLSPAERYAAAKNRQKHPLTSEFMLNYSFPFDDFQQIGCQHLEEGKSVLVAAPTGANSLLLSPKSMEIDVFIRHLLRRYQTRNIRS
jgi:ATP-dependent RNA helicase HelY